MGKKKQNKQTQQPLSPTKFLKERARLVPIDKCYIGSDLENGTEGTVLVVRKHTGDKYTLGVFLVDKLCLGVKDTSYYLRMEWSEYRDFMERFEERYSPRECSYEEAHNWIWGAVGFAEDAGIEPCKEFGLAQYILAEDNDDVELIEYEFGDSEGKHCLLANGRLEASTYLPVMRKNLGDDFSFCLGPNDHIHGPEDWDFVKNCPLYDESMEDYENDEWDETDEEEPYEGVEYHQEHPDYPSVLTLKNQDLPVLLSCSEFQLTTEEAVDDLLKREGLREDLEQYLLFNIGMTNDEAYREDPSIYENDDLYDPNLYAAFRLLAEIGDERSTDVVLEGLRQWDKFNDFHYGDVISDGFVPALAKLAYNQLDKLKDFAMEPGLDDLPHTIVFDVMWVICEEHREKRDEILAWFKEILCFALDKMQESKSYFSKSSIAWAIPPILSIGGKELLPEIKDLYDAKLIDTTVCGSYKQVEEELKVGLKRKHDFIMDIHDWMSWYVRMFGNETKTQDNSKA